MLGTTLAHYSITEKIGQGGMGEVYRARDTRLQRDVALKVLPDPLASDTERLERFRREAETLASLNHSGIVMLHSIEEVDGVNFLTMELVEGQSLDQALPAQGLPWPQVLEIGTGIASALAAAHEKGVVHRDLKPSNIMLSKQGVKLLDFGLATSAAPASDGDPATTPTRSVNLTGEGVLVGTPQYMSPEQLKGLRADTRTDIFSLGLVLYEMMTGRKAFQADTMAELISEVLSTEPEPLSSVRPDTPDPVDRLVRMCLRKDPADRWQSAHDLMLELQWISDRETPSTPPGSGLLTRERLAWLAVASLSVVLALVLSRPEEPSPVPQARFDIEFPESVTTIRHLSPSPDGRSISFSAGGKDVQLWLRPLDGTDMKPLSGTRGVATHFWSPDSRSIAFLAGGELKKIDVDGGLPRTLCQVPGFGPFSFGSWSRDGVILFDVTEAPGQNGLYRVPASGGSPTKLALRDRSGQPIEAFWPCFLPDGQHFLIRATRTLGEEEVGIWVSSLETLVAHPVHDADSYFAFVSPGHLLYVDGGVLMAQPFDPERRKSHGKAIPVVDRVDYHSPTGWALFGASSNGVIVHANQNNPSRIVLKDRQGKIQKHFPLEGFFEGLDFSPDDRELAVGFENRQNFDADIWTIDLERGLPTRFTSHDTDVGGPRWLPDGSAIVYSTAQDAPPFLHRKSRQGGSVEVLIPSTGTLQWASDWSRDGRHFIYSDRHGQTNYDLWILTVGEPPRPFLRTSYAEAQAAISPDARWVAYTSNETGRFEVYVSPFSDTEEKIRVSAAGGSDAHWTRDGKELIYLNSAREVVAVSVETGDRISFGSPEVLFTHEAKINNFDVTADGQRFALTEPVPGSTITATVLTGWASPKE